MPKISIVMPVYNTGEILAATIRSILNQTFQDFELILVDDGSTDISASICDKYAQADSRVIVIHQINKGICAARNAGIKLARSKYITFCDHDDIYFSRKLEIQYSLAIKYNADIVNVGYKSSSNINNNVSYFQFDCLCNNKQEIKENIYDITYFCLSTIWVKLYNLEKLRDVFYFDEKYIHGHEDINFNLKLLLYIDSFISTKEVLYEHIVRTDLSTSAKMYKDVLLGISDHLHNFTILITYFDELNNKKELYCRNVARILRLYAIYSVKLKISRRDFVTRLKEFQYSVISISLIKLLFHKDIMIKDIFVYYGVMNKWYSFLFFVLKMSRYIGSFSRHHNDGKS